MALEWLERLRCPKTQLGDLSISSISAGADGGIPEDGYLVCESGGIVYDIRDGILNLAPNVKRSDLTLAGWSNHFPLAPQVYERLWRPRALTIMTGERFPIAREWQLLNDWTEVRQGECILDLGTSTGLYARGLAACRATIFAVDLAWSMLREARRQILHEKRRGIVLMRAAAENLPFLDNSLDAVVVGGSLNEFKSIPIALAEARRVVRPGGRLFVTSLTKAKGMAGRFVQRLVGLSGIQFPTVTHFNAMLQKSGWRCVRQEQKGIVLFTLAAT